MSRLEEKGDSVSHERVHFSHQSDLLSKMVFLQMVKNLGCMVKKFILLFTDNRIVGAEWFSDWRGKKGGFMVHMNALASESLLERIHSNIHEAEYMAVMIEVMFGVI